jgi:hypothetical protein
MRRAEEEVKLFAEKIIEKATTREHYGHWSTLTDVELLLALKQELRELTTAAIDTNYTASDVLEECVDVALYAMFMADNFGGLKE